MTAFSEQLERLEQVAGIQAHGHRFFVRNEVFEANELGFVHLGNSEPLELGGLGQAKQLSFWGRIGDPRIWVQLVQGKGALGNGRNGIDYGFFKVPLAVDEIEEFAKTYFQSLEGFPLPSDPPIALVLATSNSLKEQPDPFFLNLPGMKTIRFFLGMGTLEQLHKYENGANVNPFLFELPVTLGTSSGGRHSQYWSQFSRSLWTYEFHPRFGTQLMSLRLDYLSVDSGDFAQEMEKVQPDPIWERLPDDLPIDLAGAMFEANFDQMKSFGQTIVEAEEGNYNSFLEALLCAPDSAFENELRPFMSHEKVEYRQFLAEEALIRRNKPLILYFQNEDPDERLRNWVKGVVLQNQMDLS